MTAHCNYLPSNASTLPALASTCQHMTALASTLPVHNSTLIIDLILFYFVVISQKKI
jgi:hypothetical protein